MEPSNVRQRFSLVAEMQSSLAQCLPVFLISFFFQVPWRSREFTAVLRNEWPLILQGSFVSAAAYAPSACGRHQRDTR